MGRRDAERWAAKYGFQNAFSKTSGQREDARERTVG